MYRHGAQGVARIDRRTIAAMMSAASYTLNNFTISDDKVNLLGGGP